MQHLDVGRVPSKEHRRATCKDLDVAAAGTPLDRTRRDAALDAARAVLDAHILKATAGATSPNPQMVVLRVLAPQVEPAMQLLKAVRVAWREVMWNLTGEPPRIWAM